MNEYSNRYYVDFSELDTNEINHLIPVEDILESMGGTVFNNHCVCPVHAGADNPMGMSIDRNHNTAHCWTQCQKSYDIIELVSVRDNINRAQAVLEIIEEAGLDPLSFEGITERTFEKNPLYAGIPPLKEAEPKAKEDKRVIPVDDPKIRAYFGLKYEPREGQLNKNEDKYHSYEYIMTKADCMGIVLRAINDIYRPRYHMIINNTDRVLKEIGLDEGIRDMVKDAAKETLSFYKPYLAKIKAEGKKVMMPPDWLYRRYCNEAFGSEKGSYYIDAARFDENSLIQFDTNEIENLDSYSPAFESIDGQGITYDIKTDKPLDIDITGGNKEIGDFLMKHNIFYMDYGIPRFKSEDNGKKVYQYSSQYLSNCRMKLYGMADRYQWVKDALDIDLYRMETDTERKNIYETASYLVERNEAIALKALYNVERALEGQDTYKWQDAADMNEYEVQLDRYKSEIFEKENNINDIGEDDIER